MILFTATLKNDKPMLQVKQVINVCCYPNDKYILVEVEVSKVNKQNHTLVIYGKAKHPGGLV